MIKGNVDDVLKQKLDKVQGKKYINIDMLNKNSNKKVFQLVAGISIIFLFSAFCIIAITNKNTTFIQDNRISKNIIDNDISNSNSNVVDNITNSPQIIEMAENSYGSIGTTQYVLIVKIESILGSTNFSKKINNYSYPITNLRAKVLKVLKGNYELNTVDFYTFGGKIKLSDYEHGLLPADKVKLGIDNKSQEEKENTYITAIPNSTTGMPMPEVNNTYIVSLTFDNIMYNSLGVVIGEKCNFRLYDINSDKYKNNSGDWVTPKI